MTYSSCLHRLSALGRGGIIGLAVLLLPAPGAFGADQVVPNPAQAYWPEANSVLYVDVARFSQSAIGRLLADQMKDLPSKLSELPGAEGMPIPTDLPFWESFEGLDLAEVVMVSQSETEGAAANQFSANDVIVAATRFTTLLEDQEAFIGQMLALAEQERPGSSNEVAATRTQLGAAEVFELPSDIWGEQPLPFPVSMAIGPGQEGTVLAVGRSEQLKTFLSGQTTGQLPAKVTQLMPNLGQVWLYSAVPPEAMENALSGGAAAAQGNPMVEGLMNSMKQMRDFGLNLRQAGGAMDVELLLGFAASAPAAEMAQGLQPVLMMAQMMASQDPANAMGFLTKLKASAAGEVLRLSTSVSSADIQKIIAQAGGTVSGRSRMATPGAGTGRGSVVTKPLEEDAPPVELEFLGILPSEGGHLRHGKLRIKNSSDKAVAEVRIAYVYRDARGARVGGWTRQERDLSRDTMVIANGTREMQVTLFSLPIRTEQVAVSVEEVVFTDGTKWTLPGRR